MSKINNLISAEEIVLMVENNNSLGWEHLYDRYSPMMYGAILRLTGNEKLAEEILTESFLQLKKNISLLKNRKPLYLQLLQPLFIYAAEFAVIMAFFFLINKYFFLAENTTPSKFLLQVFRYW